MYQYPARFERDRRSGSYTVTFPDFDWGVTQGDDLDDAMFMSLPASEEAKVVLYAALREAGLRNSDLARRLRQPVAHVDRLLDLHRRSKMDDIESALRALGKSISIEVRSAA
jgi:predicted RNase H-like HicB family nuclease